MCALWVKVRVRELTRSTIKIIIKLLLISRNFFFFFRFWRCFRLHEARLINFLRRRAQLFQKGVFKTRDSLTNWGFGRRAISLARSRAKRDSWIVAAWESLRSELYFFFKVHREEEKTRSFPTALDSLRWLRVIEKCLFTLRTREKGFVARKIK